MTTQTQPDAFVVSPDDPLADAHAAVAAWIEERGGRAIDDDINLKKLQSGQKLLKAKPAEQRRYVLAALVQADYWDNLAKKHKAECANARDFDDPRVLRFAVTNGFWKNACAVVESLVRRDLPLESAELSAVADWCAQDLYTHSGAVTSLVRAVERFASRNSLDETLLAAMKRFATVIRPSWRESAAKIDELCAAAPKADGAPSGAVTVTYSPVAPGPAGTKGVLAGLKRSFGISADGAPPDATLIGPDDFPKRARAAQSLLVGPSAILGGVAIVRSRPKREVLVSCCRPRRTRFTAEDGLERAFAGDP